MNSDQKALEVLIDSIFSAARYFSSIASYDKTFRGTIQSINGAVYTVRINGSDYEVKSDGQYSVGDTVYVLFAQSNPNNKFILGKVGS